MLDKPAVDHGELIYTAALGHNFLGVTTRSDERCCKPNHFHTPVLPLSECGRPALPPIPPNCVLRPCYVNIEFDYSFLSFTNRLSVCVCVCSNYMSCHVFSVPGYLHSLFHAHLGTPVVALSRISKGLIVIIVNYSKYKVWDCFFIVASSGRLMCTHPREIIYIFAHAKMTSSDRSARVPSSSCSLQIVCAFVLQLSHCFRLILFDPVLHLHPETVNWDITII